MKIIGINADFIMKDSRRITDRTHDMIYLEFSVERRYGTTVQSDDDTVAHVFNVQVEKQADGADMWDRFKDAGRDELLESFYTDMAAFLSIYPGLVSGELTDEDYRTYLQSSTWGVWASDEVKRLEARVGFDGLALALEDAV